MAFDRNYSLANLMRAKERPADCSEIRWRIELKRRKRAISKFRALTDAANGVEFETQKRTWRK